MIENNKAILEKANAAIMGGDHEGFLSLCTDDTEWTFVGDRILRGKQAVREWMATTYVEPPRFMVENLIAEGVSNIFRLIVYIRFLHISLLNFLSIGMESISIMDMYLNFKKNKIFF